MATAHQLSTIVNSCVKAPVNPKTGLAFTENERKKNTVKDGLEKNPPLYERDADYMDVVEDPAQLSRSGVNLFDTANTLMETLPAELADLSDDDFYKRLLELRDEHKKTLQICEQLYNNKVSGNKLSSSVDYGVFNRSEVASKDVRPQVAGVDENYAISHEPALFSSQSADTKYNSNGVSATKPPTGKPKRSDSAPIRSVSIPDKRVEGLHWRPLTASSTESEEEVEAKNTPSANKNCIPQKYVDDMWRNFSIDDYAPRQIRSRSSSLSRLSTMRSSTEKALNATEPKPATKEWKHKITIPKPFSMTLREAQKEPKKTKAMIELEEKRQAEMRQQAEECQKKFKATPVPAHVYLPLFDEIMEEKETQRRYARENAKEVLKSKEKPFKLSTRMEDKKQNFGSKHNRLCDFKDDGPVTKFRAKPFPEHIFDTYIDDKIKEDEEYRKVRVQMRAREMYKSASLPPNMLSRGDDYVKGKSRQMSHSEKAKKSGFVAEPKFRPKINETMPDFEEVHKKHMKELANKKLAKEATICRPFNLREHSVASSRSKVYEDLANVNQYQGEKRWTRTSLSGSLSASLDSIPAKMTNTAQLRSSATKSKLRQQMEAEYSRQQELKRRAMKEEQLKKEVSRRVLANDRSGDLQDYTKNKIHEYRQSDRARRVEYSKQLNEMKERIKDRPLLFEQISERNAQQKADRQFKATLQRAGLEEDFVSHKGRRASSSFTPEDEVSTMFSESRKYSRPSSAASNSRSGKKYTDDFDDDDPRTNHSGNYTDHGSELEED